MTTTQRLTTTILALSLGSAGCQAPSETADTGLDAVVHDSAGITIVENSPPAPDSRLSWEIGAQPSLSIGAVESGGADELFQVRDAIRLADGRIVIANSGSSELRVFNADGSHAGTWGRRGEGPGEFPARGPTAISLWPGDSIAASDEFRARLSLFDLNGAHGRDVAFDKAFAADGSLVRIVRRHWDPRTPTPAEYDEFHARTRMARLPEQPPVDSYPAFEEIMTDRDGYLWVREYRMFGEGAMVWTVFDSEGRIQGLVETPVGLDVFEIGEDYVLGLVEDELGVEYVQLWSLDREAG